MNVDALLKELDGAAVKKDYIDDLILVERPFLMKQSRIANKLPLSLVHKLTLEKYVQKDALLAKVSETQGEETGLKRKPALSPIFH